MQDRECLSREESRQLAGQIRVMGAALESAARSVEEGDRVAAVSGLRLLGLLASSSAEFAHMCKHPTHDRRRLGARRNGDGEWVECPQCGDFLLVVREP